MRTSRTWRTPGAIQIGAGALILGLPASAIALGANPADAVSPASNQDTLHASVNRTHVAYDREVVVRGQLPTADAGRGVELQFGAAGSRGWRTLASSRVSPTGHFTLRAALRRSGLLRVADMQASSTTINAHSSTASPAASGTALAPSPARRVEVGSRFTVAARTAAVLAGQTATIRGRLSPGTRGRVVRLMTRTGRVWRSLAQTRTGRAGGFRLRYRLPATGARWVRVSFAGDRANRSSWARAGELVGMRESVASWYNDGGNTACGFHATDGVANRTLPCGTKVTFGYGGRTVTATVDDRGPYVGGREYDLNQNTAAALGMGGVATVESSL
jgi:hypothetical protein